MKKISILFFTIVLSTTMFAQKGKVTLGVDYHKVDNPYVYNFVLYPYGYYGPTYSFEPKVGYFLSDNIEFGLGFNRVMMRLSLNILHQILQEMEKVICIITSLSRPTEHLVHTSNIIETNFLFLLVCPLILLPMKVIILTLCGSQIQMVFLL